VVAYRTAATPRLLDAVRRRARVGRCKLTLLVPTPYWDRYTVEAELVIELAVPLLEEAVGRPVEAVIGHPEPVDAVRELVMRSAVNEVIVSTLPKRVSRWLRWGILSRLRSAAGDRGDGRPVVSRPSCQRERRVLMHQMSVPCYSRTGGTRAS
jgi:hypothetical protein